MTKNPVTLWKIKKGKPQTYKRSLKIPKGGNQNPYIEEEQTTQWPKEREQKDKQRSTKHTHKTKDRVAQTPDILTRESNRIDHQNSEVKLVNWTETISSWYLNLQHTNGNKSTITKLLNRRWHYICT